MRTRELRRPPIHGPLSYEPVTHSSGSLPSISTSVLATFTLILICYVEAGYLAREIAAVDSPSPERSIMGRWRGRCKRGYAKNQAAIRLGKDWRPVLVLRSSTILSRGSRYRGQKAARLYRRPPPSSSSWRPGSRKQSACVQVL